MSALPSIDNKPNLWKRFFDVFFSLLVLLTCFPLFFCIALSIFISSPGAVFFVQERVGRKGKTIKCYKFRTMCIHAEKKLNSLLQTNSLLAKEYATYRKLKNDPRVFPIGRFLRKTSLDELPQFLNVLKGDLSVVGPRPAFREEVEMFYREKQEKILSIRPGITGIWQTSGRSHLSFQTRVALDEMYVDKQSFFFDLKLIGKTIYMLFLPKGAF